MTEQYTKGEWFFFDNFGKYLFKHHVDSKKSIICKKLLQCTPTDCTKFNIPKRVYGTKKVGKKDVPDYTSKWTLMDDKRYTGGYIITEKSSKFYSNLEVESSDRITFIPKDGVLNVNTEIAKWLVEEATFPFMVGLIANASVNSCLALSERLDLCYFCVMGEDTQFSLRTVREDVALLKTLPNIKWDAFLKDYYLRQNFLDVDKREKVLTAYMKMLEARPEVVSVLKKMQSLLGSKELSIIKSYFNGDTNVE